MLFTIKNFIGQNIFLMLKHSLFFFIPFRAFWHHKQCNWKLFTLSLVCIQCSNALEGNLICLLLYKLHPLKYSSLMNVAR